jgi:hypothetical protein
LADFKACYEKIVAQRNWELYSGVFDILGNCFGPLLGEFISKSSDHPGSNE